MTGVQTCALPISIRRINLEAKEVSTLLTNGQGGFRNMQFMSFDTTGDTLFVSDDHGSSSKDNREIAYILRSEEFRKAHPYALRHEYAHLVAEFL